MAKDNAEMREEIVVFITAGSDDEAKKIADRLLEQKKAACVNLISGISSYFRWQGKRDSAKETLLIVKSRGSLLEDIIRLVKEIHSYEVPEIIAVPVTGGSGEYLNWIKSETA